MAANIVPTGMTYHQGRRAYREGAELPADVSDDALVSMGLKSVPAKSSAAGSTSGSAAK